MPKVLLFDFAGVIMHDVGSDGSLHLNQELLTYLRPLKDRYQLCVYTNSFRLMELPAAQSALSSIFHKVFFAKQLNWPKTEPESYLGIAKELKVFTNEMIFVDDSPYNVTAALQAGVVAFYFQNNHQLFEDLTDLV